MIDIDRFVIVTLRVGCHMKPSKAVFTLVAVCINRKTTNTDYTAQPIDIDLNRSIYFFISLAPRRGVIKASHIRRLYGPTDIVAFITPRCPAVYTPFAEQRVTVALTTIHYAARGTPHGEWSINED